MHKAIQTLLPLALLASFLLLPELGLADEMADEAGKIEPGAYWDHITAAYIVTWTGLIGYTISLWVRRPRGAA